MLAREVLLPSLLRGLLVGGALVGPGLLLHATAGPFSASAAIHEVVFDLTMGLLVVAPAALIERLVTTGRLARVAAEPVAFVVGCAGAAGAFLQGLYADAVLHTGSLDAGLEAITAGAGVLPRLKDLLALFAAIALVTTVHVRARLARPARALLRQVAGTTAAAVSGFMLLTLAGLPLGPLTISGFMLLALAALLPPLAAAADALLARRE